MLLALLGWSSPALLLWLEHLDSLVAARHKVTHVSFHNWDGNSSGQQQCSKEGLNLCGLPHRFGVGIVVEHVIWVQPVVVLLLTCGGQRQTAYQGDEEHPGREASPSRASVHYLAGRVRSCSTKPKKSS